VLPSFLKSAVAGRMLRLLLQEPQLKQLPVRLVVELDDHLRLFEESGQGCHRWKVSYWLKNTLFDVHQEVLAMRDEGVISDRWNAFFWAEAITSHLIDFASVSGNASGLDTACENVCNFVQQQTNILCNCIATEMRRILDKAVEAAKSVAPLLSPGQFLGAQAILGDSEPLNAGVVNVISALDTSLLDRVLRSPNEMRHLSPFEFERFIADILEGLGWTVELTAYTHDHGRDIIAVKSAEQRRLLVECKRYRTKPVGISIVQRMAGVLLGDPATQGIIVTTSSFSREARDFLDRDQVKWILSGRDFNGILNWLAEYERARAHKLHSSLDHP